jgi:hypothetical protein
MRALLVVNPKATTTTERGRDVLVRALRSEVDLRVEYTRRRGHAAALAREAVERRVDVVVTLGGDGTVNEVVNGLMPVDGRSDPSAPRLAWWYSVADERSPAARRGLGRGMAISKRRAGPYAHDRPRPCRRTLLHVLRRHGPGRRGGTPGRGRPPQRPDVHPRAVPAIRVRAVLPAHAAPGAGDRARSAGRTARAGPGHRDRAEHRAVDVLWRPAGEPEPTRSTWPDVMVYACDVPSTARTVAQILPTRPDPHGRQVVRLHESRPLLCAPPTTARTTGRGLLRRTRKGELASSRRLRVPLMAADAGYRHDLCRNCRQAAGKGHIDYWLSRAGAAGEIRLILDKLVVSLLT